LRSRSPASQSNFQTTCSLAPGPCSPDAAGAGEAEGVAQSPDTCAQLPDNARRSWEGRQPERLDQESSNAVEPDTGRTTRSKRSEMNRPETIEETASLVDEAGGPEKPPG